MTCFRKDEFDSTIKKGKAYRPDAIPVTNDIIGDRLMKNDGKDTEIKENDMYMFENEDAVEVGGVCSDDSCECEKPEEEVKIKPPKPIKKAVFDFNVINNRNVIVDGIQYSYKNNPHRISDNKAIKNLKLNKHIQEIL